MSTDAGIDPAPNIDTANKTDGDDIGTGDTDDTGTDDDTGTGDTGDTGDTDDDVIVLAWHRNPWNLAALLFAVLVLAGTGGFVLGERNATPDPNSTDIGFLQDMRAHHEQAVEMSLAFLEKPDVDPTLKVIADEIAFGQSIDIGRMIQLLREYGKPEANESGTGMAWMNQPVPLDRMPGLASATDMESLYQAPGADADQIFAKLMIAHHEGGITMAQYAVEHAGTSEVEKFAAGMVSSQQSEIGELQRLIAGP